VDANLTRIAITIRSTQLQVLINPPKSFDINCCKQLVLMILAARSMIHERAKNNSKTDQNLINILLPLRPVLTEGFRIKFLSHG